MQPMHRMHLPRDPWGHDSPGHAGHAAGQQQLDRCVSWVTHPGVLPSSSVLGPFLTHPIDRLAAAAPQSCAYTVQIGKAAISGALVIDAAEFNGMVERQDRISRAIAAAVEGHPPLC